MDNFITTMSNTAGPDLIFTRINQRGSIPQWVGKYGARRGIFSKAIELDSDDNVIVIREPSVKCYVKRKTQIHNWLGRSDPKATQAQYVLCVERPGNDKKNATKELMGVFPHAYIDHMEIALGPESLEGSVWEAVEKMSRRNRDPLRESSRVAKAVEGLRLESGRLSATKIANELGISVAELAKYLGSSRQAVSKTPDAKTLQLKLRPYERIIQLRSTLSKTKFKNWINHGFPDLDGLSPLELMAAGKVAVVADFAEDAILGTPV